MTNGLEFLRKPLIVMRTKIVMAALLAVGIYNWWDSRPVKYSPGDIAPNAPQQTDVRGVESFQHNEFTITPLARFKAEARVLGRENYYLGRESNLSPVDLVLGWGPMSNGVVLEQISITQSNRFYRWRTKQFPIPRKDIERHSANMHFIPSSAAIEELLKGVKKGQLISIRGYLVKAKDGSGWQWKSSMTRNDTGGGACELVWLEELLLL